MANVEHCVASHTYVRAQILGSQQTIGVTGHAKGCFQLGFVAASCEQTIHYFKGRLVGHQVKLRDIT